MNVRVTTTVTASVPTGVQFGGSVEPGERGHEERVWIIEKASRLAPRDAPQSDAGATVALLSTGLERVHPDR
jgi:hypothetical protein